MKEDNIENQAEPMPKEKDAKKVLGKKVNSELPKDFKEKPLPRPGYGLGGVRG